MNIAVEIADRLRAEILSAETGPDEPLRQERIAQRFGVSQAPVREALRLLASEGLVVARLNRGTRVAPLDAGKAREIAALRLKLEPELIRAAAKRFGPADGRAATAALEAISEAGDVPALMRANEAFHAAIYGPAGRPVTLEIVAGLRMRYSRYLGHMWRTTGHARVSLAEHRRLVRLLRRGDGRGAGALLKTHIKASTEAVLAGLAAEPGATGAARDSARTE